MQTENKSVLTVQTLIEQFCEISPFARNIPVFFGEISDELFSSLNDRKHGLTWSKYEIKTQNGTIIYFIIVRNQKQGSSVIIPKDIKDVCSEEVRMTEIIGLLSDSFGFNFTTRFSIHKIDTGAKVTLEYYDKTPRDSNLEPEQISNGRLCVDLRGLERQGLLNVFLRPITKILKDDLERNGFDLTEVGTTKYSGIIHLLVKNRLSSHVSVIIDFGVDKELDPKVVSEYITSYVEQGESSEYNECHVYKEYGNRRGLFMSIPFGSMKEYMDAQMNKTQKQLLGEIAMNSSAQLQMLQNRNNMYANEVHSMYTRLPMSGPCVTQYVQPTNGLNYQSQLNGNNPWVTPGGYSNAPGLPFGEHPRPYQPSPMNGLHNQSININLPEETQDDILNEVNEFVDKISVRLGLMRLNLGFGSRHPKTITDCEVLLKAHQKVSKLALDLSKKISGGKDEIWVPTGISSELISPRNKAYIESDLFKSRLKDRTVQLVTKENLVIGYVHAYNVTESGDVFIKLLNTSGVSLNRLVNNIVLDAVELDKDSDDVIDMDFVLV